MNSDHDVRSQHRHPLSPIQTETRDGRDIITVRMRHARRDWIQFAILGIFWLIWTPVTVFVTMLMIEHPSCFIGFWLLFGFAGVLILPMALLGAFGTIVIEVTDDELTVRNRPGGMICHRCRRDEIIEMTLGLHAGDSADRETVPTLNIIRRGSLGQRRLNIGQLLHVDHKVELLTVLDRTLRTRGWVYEVRRGQ